MTLTVILIKRLFTALTFASLLITAEGKQPNIVMIMVDDLGWSDLGCYGSEISTPNIDALADKGLRFRRFYNNAKCGSSRANLLMGDGRDASQGSYNMPTLAHVLKDAGYHTYSSGKHHSTTNLFEKGFDRYYGLRDGMCNHFNPGLKREGEAEPLGKGRVRYWCDDALSFETKDPKYQHYFPKGFYSTDAFTSKALEYLAEWEKAETGRPFFLYLAYTAPHDPLHAWPRDIAKYKGQYDVGYESIREARYQKQLDMGLINKETYPISEPTHATWSSLSVEEKSQQATTMEIYAAMIDCIDQKVGQLVETLKKNGAYENTLIMFCSDNGAEKVGSRKVSADMGSVGSYISIGRDWGNVCNTPFRKFKTSSFNGGSRTSMIMHWPKGLKNPGRFSDKFGHLVDVMPTVIELSGGSYPDKNHILQGESFHDVITDQTKANSKPIFMQRRAVSFIIEDGFKLVSEDEKTWHLYDLNIDETETLDLASEMSEKHDQLLSLFNEWAKKK